jgi:hypothetical protein
MDVSFVRGDELSREQRTIPASLYNKIRILFVRISGKHLFVPIRSMQYLAAIDNEEIVFVDGQGPRTIEIAWRDFRPSQRKSLHESVAYTCVYYDEKGHRIMNRLHSEFAKALELMESRQPKSTGATVTPIDRD